jgi:23S rRNA U2552 (ribose-2'-O)-methylase RlmE/FtsJ
MYSYKIVCRPYQIPEIQIQEKSYDLSGIIHYFTTDMYKLSKITRINQTSNQSAINISVNQPQHHQTQQQYKKQYIEQKAREWLTERLNKLMLGTSCINSKCQTDLRTAKSLIDKGNNNLFWDRVRMMVNPYELIYFTSKRYLGNKIQYAAAMEPLSRSFFKMVEMGNKNLMELLTTPQPIITVGLAEGPGGFIEALIWLRSHLSSPIIRTPGITHNSTIIPIPDLSYTWKQIHKYDKYYGITLLDSQSTEIPSWKKSSQFLQDNPQVNILTGSDGTGNLYSIANLKYLAARFAINKANLVTADGGFDFSTCGVYNCQEQTASKLILAEIIGCFSVLGRGGQFICKFFDLNNKLTADLLYLLQCHFTELMIFKPKTSRLANSEKYIIASGFKGCAPQTFQQLLNLLDRWNTIDAENEAVIQQISANWHIASNKHTNTTFRTINSIFDVKPDIVQQPTTSQCSLNFNPMIAAPSSFYAYLNRIICEMNQLQITNINETIEIINDQLFFDQEWQEKTREKQMENARCWCLENGIPFI